MLTALKGSQFYYYLVKLKKDIDRSGSLARKWGMRFQPINCSMMQLTNKWTRKFKLHANLRVQCWKMLKVSNTSM